MLSNVVMQPHINEHIPKVHSLWYFIKMWLNNVYLTLENIYQLDKNQTKAMSTNNTINLTGLIDF